MRNRTVYAILAIGLIVCLFVTLGLILKSIETNRILIEEQSTLIKGDVNNDDEITITDYTLIRLHILGLEELK